MEHAIDSQSQQGTSRRRIVLVLAAVLAVVGSWIAYVSWRTAGKVSLHQVDTGSPYKNTRSGVKYVGDAACIRCHAEIAETYRRHPMGRSLSPIASAPATAGDDDRAADPCSRPKGFEYSIENRDGHVIHQETRRDASGRIDRPE